MAAVHVLKEGTDSLLLRLKALLEGVNGPIGKFKRQLGSRSKLISSLEPRAYRAAEGGERACNRVYT